MPSPHPPSNSHPLLLGLRASGLIAPADRVLVALSGGPDSTALLLALHEEGLTVVAAHYDHALQPGSARVAAHVRELCRRLGIDLLIERRASPLPRGSVQSAARTVRYEFLERARLQVGAEVVAIAHTADDVVEGVVLHMLRGCGLAGLRGMPARRGVFVRPMLSVWREDVTSYLDHRGVQGIEDPANSNVAYARVKVRREILPALERDRPELMRQLYARAGGAQPALSRAHLTAMMRLAEPGRGGRGLDLPGGLRLRIVGETMQVLPRERHQTVAPRLDVFTCIGCGDVTAAHLRPELDLHIGHRRPGLTMRPLGGRGTRKLQDIFTDARVPREDRDAWPLVFAGDSLALVPGIAVSEEMVARSGEPSLHVTVSGIPAKVESLNSLPGVPT